MNIRVVVRIALLLAVSMVPAAAGQTKSVNVDASKGGDAAQWSRFRGPNGAGLGSESARPPSEFGPAKALAWKTTLPTGHGSPSIWGDRIFVTAFNKPASKLELIALERATGKILWRREAPPADIETVHEVSSPATSTPACDGQRIYVYYGSAGLLAYEWDGSLAWSFQMPVAKSPYGSGTSPVVSGDLVLIGRDYPPQPALFAVSKKDGKLVWKADLALPNQQGPRAAHSTPVIWQDQVLLHRPGELSGHSLSDGSRLWWVKLNSQGTSSVAATSDAIYVGGFMAMGDPDAIPEYPPFASLLEKYDANKDGKLSPNELPDKDVFLVKRAGVPDNITGAHFSLKTFFRGADSNGDGGVDEQEWKNIQEGVKGFNATTEIGVVAIRPGGQGDMTASAVLWKERRNVPEVPSPLFYHGRLYSVMNGGIITCFDAKSGKVLYRGRVGAPGAYYASPVAAGGKIFLASSEGVVTVLADGEVLKILSNNNLGDPVFGSPALMGSAVYVRSLNSLWAFEAR